MSRGSKWQGMFSRVGLALSQGSPSEARRSFTKGMEEPLESDEEELSFLARLAVLAAQYGESRLALSWVSRHESRRGQAGEVPESLSGAYEAVRIAVALAAKDHGALEDKLPRINWRDLPPMPWIFNLRLLLAVRRNDRTEFLGLLRRPSPDVPDPPRFTEPYDRGNTLRILMLHFFAAGRWQRGIACSRAAMRELAKDRAIDARLKEVEILGASGTAAYQRGDLETAEIYLDEAVEGAAALGHAFYVAKFQHELAIVYADRDEHARAEELLLQVAANAKKRGGRRAVDEFLRAGALLSASGVALDAGDAKKARKYLGGAGRLLALRDHPRYRGHYHLCRGRLVAALKGDMKEAFDELDQAERCFRATGEGDLVGLAKVRLYRGKLHLKLRDVRKALSEAYECARAAHASGFQPIESSCVLFKSRLLLERQAVPSETLYEEILRSLGAVRNQVALFKVVANLYLYSWDLGEHVEWTDYHLRQINRMGEILDQGTFRRLYDKHVVRGVVRRLMARTLGVDPSTLEPEEV